MKNIVIFCGGVSAEHEISIRSARNIIEAMDRTRFSPILVIISRSGTWYMQKDMSILENITKCEDPFAYGEICSLIRKQSDTFLITLNAEQTKVDIAFPLVHGPMGEDGTLQGVFEVMNLAYVGSNVLSSAIGMDKDFFKRIMSQANIPVVPSVLLLNKDNYANYSSVSETLNSNIVFVKPAVMGSSVGVFKVSSAEMYEEAVEEAFKYSFKVLVEKFIPGREIECSVLGNNNPKASCLGEIKPKHEFYSYAAKYVDPNGAELLIPADLPKEVSTKVQELAIKSYVAVGCKGLARVDFFISHEGEIYVNELNTIPGFTSISMYPKLWEASGVNYSTLVTRLIELALEVYGIKQQICLIPDMNLAYVK